MNPVEILNRPSRPLKRQNPPMVQGFQRTFGTQETNENNDSVVLGVKHEVNPFEPITQFRNQKVDPIRMQ
jgi:hypothetical protein